jgi:chemotaxis protein MotB
MSDDQEADDTDEKTAGQKAARSVPGPGGASVQERQGQPSEPPPVTQAEIVAEKARQEKVALEAAADEIKHAVHSDPALSDLSKQLAIDMTPDGLRIQIVDEVKLPMFPSGSSAPNERARLLMQKIVPILMKLHEPLSIAGHTDAAPFPGPDRTNWELSAERANATRRLLTDGGLPESRIKSVIGDADKDPLLPADPLAAANRRIAILVMREAPPLPDPQPSAKK